ncbi:MAG TPA: GTP cyclohydrolase II [Kofleriaceae bacterium]|nr:GTP cyclohydrolase II [Kofleriaceae bacterium]
MQPVERYAEADLPTPFGSFRILVYRNLDKDHVAMVRGDVRGARDVLARVHSECFTGEVLGSQRCDCRAQLDQALARIAEAGAGVLIYLRQEGRGIGLANKIRAYALQDQGIDTVDANLALGFGADDRTYEVAAAMLRDLGVESVRLLTNNPDKVSGLVAAGMPVTAQVPHWVEGTEHSQDYLKTKRTKLGHIE